MYLIETERIGLAILSEADVKGAERFWGDSEVMAESGGAAPLKVLPKVIKSYKECYKAKGLSVYGVVEKETGAVIGAAGFNIIGEMEKIELIYHFSKASWGKGYATEAAQACIELAKGRPDVRTVYASADPSNRRSIKVLEKLGFHYIEHRWFEDTQQEEPYYELYLERI